MEAPKFIYRIFNFANCKSYIGSSKFPVLRFRQHMNLLKRGKHPNNELQNDFDKYGDVFVLSVMCKRTKFRSESEEYAWMKKLMTYDNHYGYNTHDPAMQYLIRMRT